jgi:hypothetical protein
LIAFDATVLTTSLTSSDHRSLSNSVFLFALALACWDAEEELPRSQCRDAAMAWRRQ